MATGDVFKVYANIDNGSYLSFNSSSISGITIQSDTSGTQRTITSSTNRVLNGGNSQTLALTYNFKDLKFKNTATATLDVMGGFQNSNRQALTYNCDNVIFDSFNIGSDTVARQGAVIRVGNHSDLDTNAKALFSITGTYQFTNNSSDSNGGVIVTERDVTNIPHVLFSGADSVGTFTGNKAGAKENGNDIYAITGTTCSVKFQDSGTYSFDGGIVTLSIDIDQSQVTLLGRDTTGTTASYTSATNGISVTNGGQLTISTAENQDHQVVGKITLDATSELVLDRTSGTTDFTNEVAGAGTITKTGAGTLTLSGANTFTGGMTISAGKVSVATGSTSLGDGALTLDSGATLLLTGGDSSETLDIPGVATLNGTLDLTNYLTTAWNQSKDYTLMTTGSIGSTEGLTLSGISSGWGWEQSGTSILLKYSGGTLGWNWTGTTGSFMTATNWENNAVPETASDVTITKEDGVAQINENAQVKTVTLGKASNLQFTAGNTLTAHSMSMEGTGALNLTGGNLTLTNAPEFNITNSDTDNASTLTLSTGTYANVLSGNTNLTKIGTRTLTLSGTNTYTGATTVSAGILNLDIDNAIASSASVTVINNAEITATSAQTFNNLSGTESTTSINLGTNALTLNNTADSTYAGTITAASVTKTGAGMLTLSSANTFSGGATLSAGTLKLENATAAGTGTIYIGNADSDTETVRLIFGANASNKIVISADTPSTSMPVITSSNGLQTLTGSVEFNHSTTLYGLSDRLTFQGVWSGDGDIIIDGDTTIDAKDGGPRVTHDTSTNTWTGKMFIKTGMIFQPGHANTLNAANDIEVNGTLQLNNVNQTIGAISGNGTIKNRNGGNTLTVNQATDSTFSGTLTNGSGTLTFIKDGVGTLTLSGTNTYTGTTTISGGRIIATNVSAFGTGTVTNNSELEFNLTTNGTYGKAISGSGALYKTGTGTLTLSGTKDFSGTMTISAGTLNLTIADAIKKSTSVTNNAAITAASEQTFNNLAGTESSASINIGTNALTLNNTDNTSYAGTITATSVNKTGTGTLTLSGTKDFSGTMTISAGTLNLTIADAIIKSTSVTNNAAITAASTQTFNNLAGTESTASINIGTNALTLNNTDNTSYAGTITATSVNKTGTGTLTLSGINDFDGATTVSAGTLVLTVDNAIASSASVTVAENATINYGATSQTLNALTGTGTITGETGGTLTLLNPTADYTGEIHGSGVVIINNDNSDTPAEWKGTIADTITVTTTGSGALTLSAEQTYEGTTTVEAGSTVKLTDVANLNNSSAVVVNGTLDYSGYTGTTTQTFSNLTGSGSIIGADNVNLDLFCYPSDEGVKYTGIIAAGNATITKTGTGCLKLFNDETNQSLIAEKIVVSSGRLDIQGWLDSSLTVEDDAIFSPGNSIGNTEQTGDFTLSAGGEILYELSASDYDWLHVSGTATFEEGSIITLSYTGALPSSEKSYELLTSTTLSLNKADFNWDTILTNAGLKTEDWTWDITNNKIVLNYTPTVIPVPEPSTWALLILGTLGMMYFRRKK